MIEADKIKELNGNLESLAHSQELFTDAFMLCLESLKRIATAHSMDARLDASNTLRGVIMLLAESQQ